MKIVQLLFVLLLIPFISYGQRTCSFTYEQGYEVGCDLAQMAMDEGCENNNSSCLIYNLYSNTLEDFALCNAYVAGVSDAWEECFIPPTFLDRDGGAITQPFFAKEKCTKINNNTWVCHIE